MLGIASIKWQGTQAFKSGAYAALGGTVTGALVFAAYQGFKSSSDNYDADPNSVTGDSQIVRALSIIAAAAALGTFAFTVISGLYTCHALKERKADIPVA